MNQGPIWGQFMKKTRGQKSRATVPLKKADQYIDTTLSVQVILVGQCAIRICSVRFSRPPLKTEDKWKRYTIEEEGVSMEAVSRG
jgi:hypothetical protein